MNYYLAPRGRLTPLISIPVGCERDGEAMLFHIQAGVTARTFRLNTYKDKKLIMYFMRKGVLFIPARGELVALDKCLIYLK